MAKHQLVGLLIANITDVKFAVLSADDAIEHHVLQDITQLLFNILVVTFHQGIAELESLLYRVRAKALEGLLFIPWTLDAQTVLHIE